MSEHSGGRSAAAAVLSFCAREPVLLVAALVWLLIRRP